MSIVCDYNFILFSLLVRIIFPLIFLCVAICYIIFFAYMLLAVPMGGQYLCQHGNVTKFVRPYLTVANLVTMYRFRDKMPRYRDKMSSKQ